MWIRSQNKTKLLKAECIEYSTRREQITEELKDKKGKPIYYGDIPVKEVVEETIYHCIFINNLNCGKYSTEEKALKVLDEIQKRLCVIEQWHMLKGLIERTPQNKIEIDTSGFVFQMPQDNEV